MSVPAVGVMGGTFDPIHHGHLVAASEVAHRFALDHVVFVPTGQPWQKRATAAAEHRYLMSVIATAADPRFRVSRVDIDRGGPTYTADTLRELQAEYGSDVPLLFITGADALAGVQTWHRPDEVLRLARLVGVTRPEHTVELGGLPEDRVSVVAVPALAISSTDIRGRVRAGSTLPRRARAESSP